MLPVPSVMAPEAETPRDPPPTPPPTLRRRAISADDPLPTVNNILLVMSGKGGVGKSSVATNLAMALLRAGFRVGLLDADIYGPSIPTMLGVAGRPVSLDGKTIEPLSRFGLKLMSIGFLLEDPKAAVIWRGPMLHGALQQFMKDVSWGELDFLVMDLPPGTGDVALTLSQRIKATGAVMVTTPQAVATDDVFKSVSMCKKVGIPILGVVENMSWFIDSAGVRHELFGAGGGAAVAEFAEVPLLGQVPLEPVVREWGDKGTPVVQAASERGGLEGVRGDRGAHHRALRRRPRRRRGARHRSLGRQRRQEAAPGHPPG